MPESSARPVIVYLAGNNGSGKTTLGRALAARTNFIHLPEEKFETSYLNDLFRKQSRWSFEAQTHFLAFKIAQVQYAVANNANAFIDRSPYEDAEIFAKYFYTLGKMDRRSYSTYTQLYKIFKQSIPSPTLIIYCRCPLHVLTGRVSQRGRNYEELYPPDHLYHLDSLYSSWLKGITTDYPGRVYEIDTEIHDLTSPGPSLDQIAREILDLVPRIETIPQMELFSPEPDNEQAFLFPQFEATHQHVLREVDLSRESTSTRPSAAPRVYIAAPFTDKAGLPPLEEDAAPDEGLLFTTKRNPPHGVITDEGYRTFLEGIDRTAKACGFETILPHRDINKWGARSLTPEKACAECTQHVYTSDLVVAFPQSSFGAHYEVGVAVGYGLPVLLLVPENEQTSFMMQGLTSQPGVSLISFSNATELAQKLTLRLTDLARTLRR